MVECAGVGVGVGGGVGVGVGGGVGVREARIIRPLVRALGLNTVRTCVCVCMCVW